MNSTAFFAASLSPVIIGAVSLWFIRKIRFRIYRLVCILIVIINLPIGLIMVAMSIGLKFEVGRDHSPGIGIAFLPVVLAWLVLIVVSGAALIMKFWVSYLKGKR
jgi:ABC-type lipoprotein release transport system permease subunit